MRRDFETPRTFEKPRPEAGEQTRWEQIKERTRELVKEYGLPAAVGAALFAALETIRSHTGVDPNQMAQVIETFGMVGVSATAGVVSKDFLDDLRMSWGRKRADLEAELAESNQEA